MLLKILAKLLAGFHADVSYLSGDAQKPRIMMTEDMFFVMQIV